MYDENRNVVPVHDLKLEALKEIVEAADGKPVLVAWTYQFDRDRIINYFRSMKPRELKTAQDINDWNAGKVQLMLAHPASAGHGINLQAGGNIIVWYGLTWSLELYQQFNARLYRQGQKHYGFGQEKEKKRLLDSFSLWRALVVIVTLPLMIFAGLLI